MPRASSAAAASSVFSPVRTPSAWSEVATRASPRVSDGPADSERARKSSASWARRAAVIGPPHCPQSISQSNGGGAGSSARMPGGAMARNARSIVRGRLGTSKFPGCGSAWNVPSYTTRAASCPQRGGRARRCAPTRLPRQPPHARASKAARHQQARQPGSAQSRLALRAPRSHRGRAGSPWRPPRECWRTRCAGRAQPPCARSARRFRSPDQSRARVPEVYPPRTAPRVGRAGSGVHRAAAPSPPQACRLPYPTVASGGGAVRGAPRAPAQPRPSRAADLPIR
eukprot:scaffold2304_cov30-Tisochrysis_lutea.AAC.3